MASRPSIKQSLQILNTVGLDPFIQNTFSKLRVSVVLLSIIVIFCDCFLSCLVDWKGLIVVDGITADISIYQMLIKIFTIIQQRKKLIKILRNMDQFWSCNKYGLETQMDVELLHKVVRKYLKWFAVFFYGTAILYFIQALAGSVRRLAVPSFLVVDLYKSPNYELIFVLQMFVAASGVTFVIGFDLLFILLVINITCELKLIRKGIENIAIKDDPDDSDESLAELFKIIEHHNLTLDTNKDIKEMYAILLLNVFFFNMVLICSGLLCIIANGFPPSLQILVKYGLFEITYAGQLFFYCSAGSYLTTEAENISTAIYNINWWAKTQPKLRAAAVMVIRRANKAEKLTAGGMFDLDLDSFTKIMKASLSFFTVVKAMFGDT